VQGVDRATVGSATVAGRVTRRQYRSDGDPDAAP